jgi:hypothetical protein
MLTLEKVVKAQRGSSDIPSLTFALAVGWLSTQRPGHFKPGKESRYPLYERLGGSRAGLDGGRNLAPTGFRSQDRPARSESLYRLNYSGLWIIIKTYYLFYLVKSF